MLYPEVPFLERFELAVHSGFKAVEFLFPYAAGLEAVHNAVKARHLPVVLFNLPAGEWEKGERGIAIFPDRRQEFRDGVGEAIRYAQTLGTSRLNCLAGKRPPELEAGEAWRVLAENVRYAAAELAKAGLTLLVEPINPFDIPGFFINSTREVISLLNEVGLSSHSNVKIQYDIYHMQRTQGDIINTFNALKAHIGHIQIADNPGRHQPGTGELHYGRIFQALEDAQYSDYIGLEYIPLGSTEDSLEWWRHYELGQPMG